MGAPPCPLCSLDTLTLSLPLHLQRREETGRGITLPLLALSRLLPRILFLRENVILHLTQTHPIAEDPRMVVDVLSRGPVVMQKSTWHEYCSASLHLHQLG